MLAAHGCPPNADCCTLEQSFGPPSPSWPEGAIPVIIGDTIRGVWVQGDLLQLAQGAEGAPGSQILVGTGSPASSLGAISDLYIDATSPNQFFQKTGPTTWTLRGTLQGNPGVAGPPGSQILSGSGAPAGGLGVVGDFYVDTVAPNGFYRKTGVSTWTLQGTLQGAVGPAGPSNPFTYFFVTI